MKARRTQTQLEEDLEAIGITRGITLMVHSSLSSIGWVDGGPPTVVRALLAAVGTTGTLAMPAATPPSGDPETWPIFDRATTPTSLGAISEAFRTWPQTRRSDHPLESVCARGPSANTITAQHPLEFSEGRGGPFGKLYDLDSSVLLLGVGFNRCTALHFAESLSEKRRVANVRFPSMMDGRRVWIEVPNVADDNDRHFPIIGERYLAAGRAQSGWIGEAPCALFPMRDLVDFAVRYFDAVL